MLRSTVRFFGQLIFPTLLFATLFGPARAAAQSCNAPPVATDDTASTFDIWPVLVDVLANDADPDGQPLTVSILGNGCRGQVALLPDGALSYLPIVGQAETCAIVYRVSDPAGAFAQAGVTVTVTILTPEIFADGFESGDTSAWSTTE